MKSTTKLMITGATILGGVATGLAVARINVVRAQRRMHLLAEAKATQSAPVVGGWLDERRGQANPEILAGGVLTNENGQRQTHRFTADLATGQIEFLD